MKHKRGIEYWRTQKTDELRKVAAMIDRALRYGFKLMNGDKTVEEIQKVLRERS